MIKKPLRCPFFAAFRSSPAVGECAHIGTHATRRDGYCERNFDAVSYARHQVRTGATGDTSIYGIAVRYAWNGWVDANLHNRAGLPRFTPEAMKANQALIDLLANIAKRKNATPAQIALAWLLAQKPWIVPIPGTTKLNRLDENNGAVSIKLTPDDLREIENAAAQIKVEGARYPEKLEQMTGR